MRRTFVVTFLAIAACVAATSFAQAQVARSSANAGSNASARSAGKQLDIASRTQLNAQLEGTLDASRARVGDRVVLKTTEAIRSGGDIVVKKGARLVGRVTEVGRRTKGDAESSITLVFDRLESGSHNVPVSVVINSLTQASARARMDDEELSAGANARGGASTSTQSNSNGGGLLGGVTGAVGNTVGGATRATGDVLNSTTETVGGTVNNVGRGLGRIRISQSSDVSVGGSSRLSLTGGNLRLDKGTTFRLTVSEAANVGNR